MPRLQRFRESIVLPDRAVLKPKLNTKKNMLKQLALIAASIGLSLAAIPASAETFNARGFNVSSEAIAQVRLLLIVTKNPFAVLSDRTIANSVGLYCEVRSMGNSDEIYRNAINASLNIDDPDRLLSAQLYFATIVATGKVYTCKEFAD